MAEGLGPLPWLTFRGDGGSAAPALRSGRTTYAWSELRSAAGALARHCRALGLGAGDRVAVYMREGPELIVALLGLWQSGCGAVLLDHRLGPELDLYLREARPVAVITDSPERFPAEPERGYMLIAVGDWAHLPPISASRSDLDLPATYHFSSGTTGPPKLVAKTHRTLLAEVDRYVREARIGPADRLYAAASLTHVYAFGSCLLSALRTGATLVLRTASTPRSLWAEVEETGVTAVFGVAPVLEAAARVAPAEPPRKVRLYVVGGGPTEAHLFHTWQERIGAPLATQYGLTEVGTVTLDLSGTGPPSVGRPLDGVEVEVRPVPGSAEPVIHLRVRHMPTGYDNGTPTGPGGFLPDGWFCTLDVGEVASDGSLRIYGRLSDFINVGGLKVNPYEVETVLRGHPAVMDVAVVGLPHPGVGEAVVAFVVPSQAVDDAHLLTWCRERLAPYKIPKHIFRLTDIPRTVTGKVLRRALVERALADAGVGGTKV